MSFFGYINYLCTYDLYSPVHNVLDACISIMRGSGRGWRRTWSPRLPPGKPPPRRAQPPLRSVTPATPPPREAFAAGAGRHPDVATTRATHTARGHTPTRGEDGSPASLAAAEAAPATTTRVLHALCYLFRFCIVSLFVKPT